LFFFLFEKIFFWRSTRSRSSRLEFAREENRNPRFVVDRHWTFAASTLTGVKKVPYNIIYLLTYELGAEPFFLFLFFLLFFLRMHKYHNRSRFTLVYECVMCMRMLFSLYIFIIFVALVFAYPRRSKTAINEMLSHASHASLPKFRSRARFGSSNDSRDPKSSLWNFVLTVRCNALCRILIFFIFHTTFPDAKSLDVRN